MSKEVITIDFEKFQGSYTVDVDDLEIDDGDDPTPAAIEEVCQQVCEALKRHPNRYVDIRQWTAKSDDGDDR